jgi:hypothetical protein
MANVKGTGTKESPWQLPPLMEALGLAEVEHNPKNNRMRAI